MLVYGSPSFYTKQRYRLSGSHGPGGKQLTTRSTGPEQFVRAETDRIAMPVTAVRCYPNCLTYPLCPRCILARERKYQHFCEHCGHALDWKCLSKDHVVFAQSPNVVR